ncbi:hypothetical protein MAR_014167 [Mya arenaria]|uniref:G-protein coupled receptors family 1 profile domain-containing protein n=1 Tax=Mya arenaria TaxID=6604 RepID=A0ABY7G5L8_MYAAR|nr:hypothetical protein MAR_014167 [Mya arenaria]
MNATNCTNCSDLSFETPETAMYLVVYKTLYLYILPIIVFVGLFGNLMSIYLIVVDKPMRNVSSSIFLMSLLGADTGMLLCLLLVWLETLGYPLNHLPAVCRINVYLTYVYVVCITVETFITICYPTKIKQMCTLFRARIVTLVLLITALGLYVIAPLINKVQEGETGRPECRSVDKYAKYNQVIFYTDSALTLVVPFFLLIILLAFMTVAIMQSIQKKQQRSLKKTNENGTQTNLIRRLPQVRVAKMLYILSVSVVFLNAPSHFFKLKSLITNANILGYTEGLIYLICMFISYTSFAIKFFICIACSKNFRKLFFMYCCCWQAGRYHSIPQQTMETAT